MLIWIEQPLLINKGMVYLIIIIKTSLIKLINILSVWTLVNVNQTATNVFFWWSKREGCCRTLWIHWYVVVSVNTLVNKIARLFSKDNINWGNLVSDSTNFMCGKKVSWQLYFMKKFHNYLMFMEAFFMLSRIPIKSFTLL